MRIVFMGTPSFAATVLEELAEQHEVVAVYTRPDAVRGRGKALLPSPVKELAQREGIPVRTPKTLRDRQEQEVLASYEPDVVCVAAYGMILPPEVLSLPRLGCVNVHASLLPRWRGAAPVERAILAGDERAGVCIMRMEEGLDTGAYCICRETEVAEKEAARLTDELANLGARALLTALEGLASDRVVWIEQDEAQATHAAKVAKGELDLNPSLSAVENARKVRASSDAHPSRCRIAGKDVTVLAARVFAKADGGVAVAERVSALAPGEALFAAKKLLLVCAEGTLEVLEVKPDGKKAMDAKAFAAGLQVLRNGSDWGMRDV